MATLKMRPDQSHILVIWGASTDGVMGVELVVGAPPRVVGAVDEAAYRAQVKRAARASVHLSEEALNRSWRWWHSDRSIDLQ